MNKYIFHGVVLPERVDFTITPFNCELPNEKVDIILQCYKSKIISECISHDENINIFTLKNIVENTLRIFCDVVGFSTACGYDVEIESVYDFTKKELTIFGVHENIFEEHAINESTNKGIPYPGFRPFSDIVKIVGANIELQISLSDFREAIKQPNFTSFHCYRAIESLKQVFPGKDDLEKWKNFRETLNIDRSNIDEIINYAKNLRHGKHVLQPWETRCNHILNAWRIIKKYIDYKAAICEE